MKVTKQAKRDAKQLFRCCLVDGVLDEGRVRQVVDRLTVLKPRQFEAILEHFHRLVELEIARLSATVESASHLSDEARSRVKANLDNQYGTGLRVSFKENPELIGGLRIQVGSDVFDGSVRARLNALRESF